MLLLCLILQDGLTRQQLDVALLVAEAESIAGLPAYPAALPLSQSDAELTSFGLRRVESTASSHALLRAELMARLALLQVCQLGLCPSWDCRASCSDECSYVLQHDYNYGACWGGFAESVVAVALQLWLLVDALFASRLKKPYLAVLVHCLSS